MKRILPLIRSAAFKPRPLEAVPNGLSIFKSGAPAHKIFSLRSRFPQFSPMQRKSVDKIFQIFKNSPFDPVCLGRGIRGLILILSCIYICGCWSLPCTVNYNQLYSITKEEKKIKSRFGSKKSVSIKDFRENEIYDENISALRAEVEKYILSHPDLGESAKNNLRELKVTAGAAKDEVRLLLGNPDKVMEEGSKTTAGSEIWIYRINKRSTFLIIVIPVFFTNDGYYLYFSRPALKSEGGIPPSAGKNNVLAAIERHYFEQVIKTESPLDSARRSKK